MFCFVLVVVVMYSLLFFVCFVGCLVVLIGDGFVVDVKCCLFE